MAQASSAQREPSMEEILASIRRIIEDSDTMRKQGDEPSVAGRVPEAAAFEAKPLTGSVVDVDAFRAELRSVPEAAVNARQAVPEVAPEKKPMTLAEVQAQIAAGGVFLAAGDDSSRCRERRTARTARNRGRLCRRSRHRG